MTTQHLSNPYLVCGDTDSHNPVGVHFFACSCVPLYLWCLWSRVNNVMSLAWSRVPLYLWCLWSRVYVCPEGGVITLCHWRGHVCLYISDVYGHTYTCVPGGVNNVMSLAWSRAASCLWCLWSRVYVGHGYMWVTRICVYRYIDA